MKKDSIYVILVGVSKLGFNEQWDVEYIYF